MFPVLFRIPLPWGDADTYFPIRMFGVLVILGFLAGTWLVARRLKKRGILTGQETFDFCFYLLATGIVGARLAYVVQEFDQFRGRFFDVFAIWNGGLVWYGGFAFSALFAFWWLARRKLPVLEITDAAALGLALALALGRWGCFCAGDDYGTRILGADGTPLTVADEAPWYAVQFPGAEQGWRYRYSETHADFRAPYLVHAVQIYMSLANFAVLGLLLLVARTKRAVSRPGMLTAAYLLLYPPARFVVEFWRGDVDRGVDVLGTGLSFSQAFGIPIFLCGVMLLRHVLSRTPAKPAGLLATGT